jgi:hypothetical protein
MFFWEVIYEKDGRRDCLFYGGKTTEEDKNRRIENLIENGYKVLNCCKVKSMSISSYKSFEKYKVDAESIEDFLEKYTKPSKHKERGQEYVECRIRSHKEDLEKYGFTFITHHDSITGQCVSWYGNKK